MSLTQPPSKAVRSRVPRRRPREMKRGRFLIATPGFTGHATPELTLARRLVRRGHDRLGLRAGRTRAPGRAAGAGHLPFAAFQLRRPSEAVPLAEQIREGARHFESPVLAEELVDLLRRERFAVAVVDYLLAAAFTAAEAARVPTACVLPVLYTPWALWYGQHMYDDGAARAALDLHRSSGEAATALASWAKLVLVFSTRRFDFPMRGRRDRRVEYVGRMIDPELPRWDSPGRRTIAVRSFSSARAISTAGSGRHSPSAPADPGCARRVARARTRDARSGRGRGHGPGAGERGGDELGAARSGAARGEACRDERRSQHRSRRPYRWRPLPGLPAHARAGVEWQARRGVRGGTATGAERDVGRDPSGARGAPLRPRRSQTLEAGRPCSSRPRRWRRTCSRPPRAIARTVVARAR